LAKIAEALVVHADEELAHADRLARRIMQLGGASDVAPDALRQRSRAGDDASHDLEAMVGAKLVAERVAERVAIEADRQLVALAGEHDSTIRRVLEGLLAD
jgi:bacterioferritin